jgi:hypothetical protein
MYRLIIILATLLILGVPGTACAEEPAGGIINGQVFNGTEGGGSVAGIEVTLLTYVGDALAETSTTETDGEGKFQFDNVVIEHQYLVSARYMEVDYYYAAVFDTGETTTYVEVGVCDTTTSDQAIKVGIAHTIITVEEESLVVNEVFWLVNDGDRTYTGTDGVLVFTLPEGATSFEAPEELITDYRFLDNNRVTYLVPFPPGERQLVYSYRLDKPDSIELTIPLKVHYPTDDLELMVGGENIKVTVNQLAPADPVVTDAGERFIHFRGENLPRDTVIDFHLTYSSGTSGVFFTVIWTIIAIAVVSTAVYIVTKRKKRKNAGE